jgi:hypothetical protein
MKKVDLELKLRKERIERCLNCRNLKSCGEIIQTIEVCWHFRELPVSQQSVIVSLRQYKL